MSCIIDNKKKFEGVPLIRYTIYSDPEEDEIVETEPQSHSDCWWNGETHRNNEGKYLRATDANMHVLTLLQNFWVRR